MKYSPAFIVCALVLHCVVCWDVGHYLSQVADEIMDLLEEPKKSARLELFANVNDYIETLQDFIEKLNMKRKNAMYAARTLLEFGRPIFPQLHLDKVKLLHEYEWTETEVDDYLRLCNETNMLWDVMETAYNKTKYYFDTRRLPFDEFE